MSDFSNHNADFFSICGFSFSAAQVRFSKIQNMPFNISANEQSYLSLKEYRTFGHDMFRRIVLSVSFVSVGRTKTKNSKIATFFLNK